MKIATKLGVFFAGMMVVFCVVNFFLLLQIRTVSRGYNALLDSEVRDMDAARTVQVHFKKQVQEWKDILLRGGVPEDLARYTAQFHDEQAEVQSGGQALASRVQDAQARGLVQQFLVADKTLNEKYQTAYEAYLAGNADFKSADRIVRGQDRAPTDLFDAVVERLNARVKNSVEEQRRVVRKNLITALGLSGGLLLLLSVIGFATVRSVLNRLAILKMVSDRLARADVDGLAINISGSDEIGQFAESMKGVHAAIEELLKDSTSLVSS